MEINIFMSELFPRFAITLYTSICGPAVVLPSLLWMLSITS
jgi:hypothetical protein